MFKTDVQSDYSPLRIKLFDAVAQFKQFVLPTVIKDFLRQEESVTDADVAAIYVSGGVIWSPPDPEVGGVDSTTLKYQNLHVDNASAEVYNGLMALEDGYTVEFLLKGKR